MTRNIAIGIDIGTSTTETVVMERFNNGESPRILGAGISRSQGLRRGLVISEADVRESVKVSVREAERTSGLSVKHAYLSAGGACLSSARSKGTVVVSRADGEITQYDVKRAIASSEANLSQRLVNKHILHSFPLSYNIDNDISTHEPIGIKGAKLEAEVLFVTCFNQQLSSLVKSVESAGIAVDDVVAAPIAAARALLTKNQKEAGVVLVNIGGGTVSTAVFEEGLPISVESFPIGSNHITHDIALGLQTSIEEAENLKLNYPSDGALRRKLADIIEPRLIDIFEAVEGSLKKIGRNRLLPAGVILGGGGSNIRDIAELARAALKLPAKMECPRLEGINGRMADPVWSVAVGLCLTALDENQEFDFGVGAIRQTKNFFLHWLRSFLP